LKQVGWLAGAAYILFLQQSTTYPVINFAKITSGRGGFGIRLQVML
jgi:hypothetical protein